MSGKPINIKIIGNNKRDIDRTLRDLNSAGFDVAAKKPTAQAAPPPGMVRQTSAVMAVGWTAIEEAFIPPETAPDLRKALKRFFFAGAKHLLDTLLDDAELDYTTDELTAADASKVDAIMHEISEFFAGVAAQRN